LKEKHSTAMISLISFCSFPRVVTFLRTFPWASLLLVVGAQVAVFTDALCIERSVVMLTLKSLLCPTLRVVAIFAHTISIVVIFGMSALCDIFPVFLNRFCFFTTAGAFLLSSAYFALFRGMSAVGTFWDYVQRFVSRVPTPFLS